MAIAPSNGLGMVDPGLAAFELGDRGMVDDRQHVPAKFGGQLPRQASAERVPDHVRAARLSLELQHLSPQKRAVSRLWRAKRPPRAAVL